MNDKIFVVTGGDTEGMSAASKVRIVHPDRQIVAFERAPDAKSGNNVTHPQNCVRFSY